MVICNVCGSECRHWVTREKDFKGKEFGSATKHCNCPVCKEHWVYELPLPGEGFRLVARLLPQMEMF
jgi:hypothetical protein